MKNIKIVLSLFLLLTVFSCQDFETDLDVENNVRPSSSSIGVESTAEKLYQNWYTSVNDFASPGMALRGMADMGTCSWGNAAQQDMSSEPRASFQNTNTYANSYITEDYSNNLYSVLADANLIAKSALSGEGLFSDVEKVKAMAHFGQGAALGYLGLVFDKVWINDETVTNKTPSSYKEVNAVAVAKIDLAIVAAGKVASDTNFDGFIPGASMTKGQFIAFLNTFAARLLVNNVRNSTQRDGLDWNKILTYASNGITNDIEVALDNETVYNSVLKYSRKAGWGRVDSRVINLMDPTFKKTWDNSYVEADSVDERLETDFGHLTSNNFKVDRGAYHFSSYRHSRYDALDASNWIGSSPEMLLAENELYKAEAHMRSSNNAAAAAATINASSRTLRGGLDDVAATPVDVYKAIHYERSVELLSSSFGLGFFEMRRENLLQKGTPTHFPIAASTLIAAKIPLYTFGGTTGVAGEDYSSTLGWKAP